MISFNRSKKFLRNQNYITVSSAAKKVLEILSLVVLAWSASKTKSRKFMNNVSFWFQLAHEKFDIFIKAWQAGGVSSSACCRQIVLIFDKINCDSMCLCRFEINYQPIETKSKCNVYHARVNVLRRIYPLLSTF